MSDEQPEVIFIPATQENKDALSTAGFGMSLTEAHAKGLCLECKEPAGPKCYSEAGRREWGISGVCEKCFDEMFGGE